MSEDCSLSSLVGPLSVNFIRFSGLIQCDPIEQKKHSNAAQTFMC